MTIDFDNLSIDAKHLSFDDSLGMNIASKYGLFSRLSTKLQSLSINNINAESAINMEDGFSSNTFKILKLSNCNFNSVENLKCCFYQNENLQEIIINNEIIASELPLSQSMHTEKSIALFPRVNNIENLFTECSSIKYLDFVPMFGDDYEVVYAFAAVSFMEKLISVNFGGLKISEDVDTNTGGILSRLRHMILYGCSESLIEYKISTDDEYTINELKRQFTSILNARHK